MSRIEGFINEVEQQAKWHHEKAAERSEHVRHARSANGLDGFAAWLKSDASLDHRRRLDKMLEKFYTHPTASAYADIVTKRVAHFRFSRRLTQSFEDCIDSLIATMRTFFAPGLRQAAMYRRERMERAKAREQTKADTTTTDTPRPPRTRRVKGVDIPWSHSVGAIHDRAMWRGLWLTKSRTRIWRPDNQCQYRLVDADTGQIVLGERFDVSLAEVEAFLETRPTKGGRVSAVPPA